VILVWAALAAVNVALFAVRSSPPQVRTAGAEAAPHIGPTAGGASGGVRSTTPPPSPAAEALTPASATAYGPTGPDSGDDPGHAYQAIDSNAATAWLSDWYQSAAFGSLQDGTGLLIDMGQAVTISRVQLMLGATPGADLQLLTGNAPARSQMQLQASINNAGGQVALTLASPEPARYLLIWFTLLPPDSAGTYQVSVSDVMIEGTR
jgi:putative peptidoglycan lipid II flippase